MAKSPTAAVESMIANLAAKTGRELPEWVALARIGGAKHGAIVAFLKAEHGLTHGYANLIAQRTLAESSGAPQGDAELVAAQYRGPRAALRPIHDALVKAALQLGGDVVVVAKKTCVSLRRSRQFALIQPASNLRVDLGLKIDGLPLGGRLEAWPSTMCSHRVRLETAAQVDGQVCGWLAQAHAQAQ